MRTFNRFEYWIKLSDEIVWRAVISLWEDAKFYFEKNFGMNNYF